MTETFRAGHGKRDWREQILIQSACSLPSGLAPVAANKRPACMLHGGVP